MLFFRSIKVFKICFEPLISRRRGVLMVSALDSGLSEPGTLPGALGQDTHSHSASLHPGV